MIWAEVSPFPYFTGKYYRKKVKIEEPFEINIFLTRHPRMGDTAKNPFVLPIFDTNYTVDLVWSAGDTIDVGMLKKVSLKIFILSQLSPCNYLQRD